MICKNCGHELDEDLTFCEVCGVNIDGETLKEIKKNKKKKSTTEEMESDLNQDKCMKEEKNLNKEIFSDKAKDIINKVLFGCFIAGGVGIAIFLSIVFIGLIEYGKVYLFDGYGFTKVLSIISIILMMVCLISIIIKIVFVLMFNVGSFPTTTLKKASVIVLAVVCAGLSIWGISDSVDTNLANSNSDDYYDYGYDYDTEITKSEAIYYAKNSSLVQNEIADAYGLKFFYAPEWGTAKAEEYYGSDWRVELKGNISGYTDDYKTNFLYEKKFTATVYVNEYGTITDVYVSKR